MANKKTVVQKYEIIKALLNGETVEDFTVEEALAFCDERIEITQKKNANRAENAKPTKVQLENEGIKATILATLTTTPITIGDLMKSSVELGAYSNQKISALLTQLLTDGKVVRTAVKGKAFYALPSAEG